MLMDVAVCARPWSGHAVPTLRAFRWNRLPDRSAKDRESVRCRNRATAVVVAKPERACERIHSSFQRNKRVRRGKRAAAVRVAADDARARGHFHSADIEGCALRPRNAAFVRCRGERGDACVYGRTARLWHQSLPVTAVKPEPAEQRLARSPVLVVKLVEMALAAGVVREIAVGGDDARVRKVLAVGSLDAPPDNCVLQGRPNHGVVDKAEQASAANAL